MVYQRLSQLFFVGGLVALVFSLTLPWLVGGKRAYSQKDAKARQKAARDYYEAQHAIRHNHEGKDEATLQKDLEAAKKRNEATKAKLDEARDRGKFTASVLMWLAVGAFVFGSVFRFLQNRD